MRGSGHLDEADDVAVRVGHRTDQLAAAEVADRLLLRCAGGEQMRDAVLDVGPAHRVGQVWGAAVAWGVAAQRPDLLRSLTALSFPHPAAFLRAMFTSSPALKSLYFFFFHPLCLPERELSSGKSWESSLRSSGMSSEAAARHTERMRARGALNWYRAMMFSSPRALRAKITVPTLHLWSDGDTAIGPKGAARTPRFVAGPYTYEVLEGVSRWIPDEAPEQLDALLARHFDAGPTCEN